MILLVLTYFAVYPRLRAFWWALPILCCSPCFKDENVTSQILQYRSSGLTGSWKKKRPLLTTCATNRLSFYYSFLSGKSFLATEKRKHPLMKKSLHKNLLLPKIALKNCYLERKGKNKLDHLNKHPCISQIQSTNKKIKRMSKGKKRKSLDL